MKNLLIVVDMQKGFARYEQTIKLTEKIRNLFMIWTVWPQLSCIYLFFNFIINNLNQTSSLFNFSFMRLFLSHNPAKRAALLAV